MQWVDAEHGGAGGPPPQPHNAAWQCRSTPELLLRGFLAGFGGIPAHGLEYPQVFGKPLPVTLSWDRSHPAMHPPPPVKPSLTSPCPLAPF